MSEDDDFEQFLATARADHVASALPPETTKRVEASVTAQVSWRRALPAGIATALATSEASAAARRPHEEPGDLPQRGASTRGLASKAIAVIAPVIGLAVVAYSVTTTQVSEQPPGAVEPAAPITAPPNVETAPPNVETAPPSVETAPPNVETAPPVVAAEPAGDELRASASSTETSPPVLDPSELPAAQAAPVARPSRLSKPAAASAGRRADGSLEAELALLAEVNSALQGNRPARALTLIDEHERRFPNGALVPEFAAQRVVTLAALDRHAEACRRSAAFLAAYPKSPLVPQVRSSCVDPTESP